jgi:hypothetical protein
MTPAAKAHKLAELQKQLFSAERMPVRNYSEATAREHAVACLKREIGYIEADVFVTNPGGS